MTLTDKTMDLDKAFYDTLMRDRESYIKTVIKKVLDEKRSIAEAPEELDKMLRAALETN